MNTKGLIVFLLALLIHGCAGQPPPQMDWQGGVQAGRFQFALDNLYASWLNGGAGAKEEAVRNAKSDSRIVKAGTDDTIETIERIVYASRGDLSSTVDMTRGGWARDRIAFTKLINPAFDDFIAIEAAFKKRETRLAAEEAQGDARRTANEAALAADRAARTAKYRELAEARDRASWRCRGAECDKAFSLAQIFVDQKSDTKIQIATNTIVETYNPTDPGKVGMKIVKIPLRGDEAEIRLVVNCNVGSDATLLCLTRELVTYLEFPLFMKQNLLR